MIDHNWTIGKTEIINHDKLTHESVAERLEDIDPKSEIRNIIVIMQVKLQNAIDVMAKIEIKLDDPANLIPEVIMIKNQMRLDVIQLEVLIQRYIEDG